MHAIAPVQVSPTEVVDWTSTDAVKASFGETAKRAPSNGHDVAVNLREGGADVPMVQRSPITVERPKTRLDLAFDICSQETADCLTMATPFALPITARHEGFPTPAYGAPR